MISQSRLSLTETREGILNSIPFVMFGLPWWWKWKKILEIQCGRVKNYLRKRGIQLSDGGIGNKSKTVRFKQESWSNEAGPSLFCQRLQKTVGGDITKQARANFQYQKVLIAQTYHFFNISEPSFGVCMHTALPRLFWCHHLTIVLCIADS